MKISNPYAGRTLPIWDGEKEFINSLAGICIDPTSQLIYLGVSSEVLQLQVFTSEGNRHSTLRNPLMGYCHNMKIHKDHIYLTTTTDRFKMPTHLLKLNKKGETVNPLCGIFIDGWNIYTCVNESLTVQIFDLNLKPTKKIVLKAISFIEDTTPRDILQQTANVCSLQQLCQSL